MSQQETFVHLHVHTEFSLLDGLSRINKLVNRAQELNMPALAITDHGVMFGVMDFYNACKGAGIKPIIGMEAYLAPRGMEDRDSQLDRTPFHLMLLARNNTGYQNLLKISSEAQLRGYYYRPRIDWEFLQAHSEGLIATSGCLAAKIPRFIQDGKDDEAKAWIGEFQDIFGADNFYLELQEHEIDIQRDLNQWLVDYNRTHHTNVGLLATTDLHYVNKDDFEIHDTQICIQTGALKTDTNRLKFSDNSYYLYSYDEMWDNFGEVPQAIHNSVKIAEMCEIDLDHKGYHLPEFPVPEGFDAKTYLRHLCEIGMDWRFGDGWQQDSVLTGRLDRELGIIHDMGFDTYFLIVWDLCEFARHMDIWWNVRGSGAGSLAAYSLGITNIDPIKNSLLFERFLNPGRVSMPDIDLDYPDDQRGEMIEYTALKYGEDKVAAIITFGTLGAKAAVRDVGRVLDVPLPEVNRAVSLIPTEAKQKPLQTYVETIPDLQKIYDSEPHLRQIIDTAKELQGIGRHTSTHAAGVIVADKPLVEYIPLHRLTGKDSSNGALKAVTQFPMETCEAIGLLKVDFLGLSTLTILRRACDFIKQYRGIEYTMDNIPYRHDDPRLTDDDRQHLDEAFEMMGRGETVGVFQLESTGMQQMLRGMRPKIFENIIAGISLYRPGPMEFIPQYNRRLHGEEEVEFHHEKLKSILSETYSIIVYQEQIMQIASELFGYELGEADLMRRAVSKKKEKELKKHKAIFLERGPENGIDVQTAETIFDEIEFFANYGFNKCVVGSTEIVDAATGRLVCVEDLATDDAQVTNTLTCDTDTLTLHEGEITAVMNNGVKPVYRLTTQLGRQIDATANHPFLTFEGWRNLGDLEVDQAIAVPHNLPVAGHHVLSDDELIILSTRLMKMETEPLPDVVFCLPTTQLAVLLNALTASCSCSSEKRIRQIQHLYLRLGILTRIQFREDRNYQLTVVSGEPVLPSFEAQSQHGVLTTSSDIYWDRITAIEYVGEQPTYDLTIADTHNFVANDIIVHNSHASDYAVITVQTAFLKCHYPEEYMTALLSVQRDDSAKVSTFLEECRRMNIPILAPDVNYSLTDFAIQEDPETGKRGIRFGLAAVKNAGEAALSHIVEAREEGGPFKNLLDFCQRIDLRDVGKRALESMIRVGAMRAFGTRAQLLNALERMMSFSANHHKDQEVGQVNMFGEATGLVDDSLNQLPTVEEYSEREMLRWEKELLGLYVTGRPVDKYREVLERGSSNVIQQMKQEPEAYIEKQVWIAGEIMTIRQVYTKANDPMAILQIEDWHESAGSIEVVLFSHTWNRVRNLMESDELRPLVEGEVISVKGRFEIRRGDPQIVANEVSQNFSYMEATTNAQHVYDDDQSARIDNNISQPIPEEPPPQSADWADEMADTAYSDDIYDEETGEVTGHDDTVDDSPVNAPIAPAGGGAVAALDPVDQPESQNGNWSYPTQSNEEAIRWLRIYFQRSGDDARDRRRLVRLHGLLVSYHGNDRFSITMESKGTSQRLKFPNHTTGYCEELVEKLLTVVDTMDNIVILPNPEVAPDL